MEFYEVRADEFSKTRGYIWPCVRKYIDTIKATIVDNTTLNIAIKQHFDILVLIQTIVGDKISYDKKFKHRIFFRFTFHSSRM